VIAPALRIGYLLGPDGPFLQAMVQKTSDTGFSAPPFVQEMAAYLLDHGIEDQLRAVNAGYREKALAVRAGIEQQLGPFLADCRGGSAGFYFYLTMSDVETRPASPFFRALDRGARRPPAHHLYTGRILRPSARRFGPIGRRQLRLSYGFEGTEAILRALALMREAIPRASATLA
jgi:2-aminoadipate transaminase